VQSPRDEPSHNGSRDCGRFFLDVIGRFEPKRIVTRWSDARRRTSGEVERTIERAWQRASRRAQADGRMFFNGPLCRLIQCDANDRSLTLTIGEVSFKEFVGTNLTHPHLRYVHGPEVLADPLGVSAAVVSRDGFLLLGRRSDRVFAHTGLLHPVGGMVAPGGRAGAVPHPFRSLVDELTEELGLARDAVVQGLCLGVVRDKAILQPELIFDVHLAADVDAIRRAAATAPDGDEHEEFVPVRDNDGAIVGFLESHYQQLTPVALAALLLHGQRKWGAGWFATVLGYLLDLA
jgi:hypothetical protein